ncbi:reverse transcriptase domain-containing protein [Tanacetum coccineum]
MTVKDGVRDVHASCDYKGNEHRPHVGPHVTWDYGYEIAALVHGSLEDIPRSNTTKIEYLYAKKHNIQEKDKESDALKWQMSVPFEQRNKPPAQPRVVSVPIHDINYFCHFLDIFENYNPMDDEPMWAVDRVVALTPGSAITIPEIASEFAIKSNHLTLVKGNQFDGMPNYGKFLKELVSNKHKLEQISAAFLSDESSALIQNKVPPKLRDPRSFLIPCNFNKAFSCDALADHAENMLVEVGKFTFPVDFVILEIEEDSKVPLILGRPFLHTGDAVIRVKQKQLNLGVGTECMTFHMDFAMKQSYSNDDPCFSIDVIDEILVEDFDALLDQGSKILHSIKGTILEEKLFADFDAFIAMTVEEDFESESNTEEPPFEKITFNTDYKIKTSLEEPPTDPELKPLPDNLEYAFLEEPSFLPLIISSQQYEENKNKLVSVLKNHKQDFA